MRGRLSYSARMVATAAKPIFSEKLKARYRLPALAYLVLVFALAVAVRLALLVRSGWLLEGDDSLSTLMALAILDGDRPLMLKNQSYAGAWEPYAMAISYTLFGISRVAAKLPVLLASLAFVGACWLLAGEVAGPTAGRFAALLAAVPPTYVLVLSLKPWAPYTETMVLGSLALLGAVRLAFPRQRQRDGAWALACSVAGGLAFWMHPLAVYYLLPAAAMVLLQVRGVRLVRAVGRGLAGFALGALPVWMYNIQTGGATFRMITSGLYGHTVARIDVLLAWARLDLPHGAGLWHPWGYSPIILGIMLGALMASALVWAIVARPWRWPLARPLDIALLLLTAIPTVFVLSGFGGPILNPWGFDATGRYSPPIWNALTVVMAAFLAAVWRWRRAVAGALLGVVLAANLYGWATVDPILAFQSPYWSKLPVDNGPLLATLRTEGISHVWLNHWAAFPVMFDARAVGQYLIAYDWYDVQAGGIDRFPEYLPLVEQADRPAFVLVTDEPEPELERRLRDLGVSYTVRRVPPYVVVIPLSRKVHPSEVASALDYRY